MNILLTNRCNRRCSYCFAQERIAFSKEGATRHAAPEFIAESSFRTAVDYMRRGHQKIIGILGGEPSLHPQFLDFLGIAWDAGLHTKVFSNGLWQEIQIRALESRRDELEETTHVVVNVNGPKHTPPEQQRAQEHLLSRLGSLCTLSFNISRLDFDPEFLIDLVTTYQTRPNVRIGIAQPLAELDNEHVPIAEYRLLVPTLMRLAALCDEHDISLGFDCGFTLCMFTEEELGRLLFSGARFKAVCGPTIDVGTDLSTWSCFPLSTFCKGKLLTEFEGLDQVVRHFAEELKPLFQAGALAECVSCRHRRRQSCSGGCAAHVYRSLNP